MSINCKSLKEYIENAFSMPFVVNCTMTDGESHYSCHPDNEGEVLFNSTVYIHNNVRVIVEIEPQRHGGELLYEMSRASLYQRKRFFDYLQILRDKNAKIQFLVNGSSLKTMEQWPNNWKSLSCRITKVPLTDDNDEFDEFQVVSEWMKHSICLIFATLTITDVEEYPQAFYEEGYAEGTAYQTVLNKYERNPINRELCLAKKGYRCNICNFDFKEVYGSIGKHFIEVHHITPVSMLGSGYKINIDEDLIPVCSNCHSMLHKKNPPYLPDELKSIIKSVRENHKQVITMAKKNVLMAITYSSQVANTIASGKIAVGIEEELLRSIEYNKIEYILLHNWQNENAHLYKVAHTPKLVSKEDVSSVYFLKYKDEETFLLIDIDNEKDLFEEKYDILHLQPSNRKLRYDLISISIEELLEPNV